MAIQYSFEKIMSMSSKDILKKVDVSNLDAFNRAQQAAIVRKVGNAMNKRRKNLKELRKTGVYSAAYESVRKEKYFSAKGKGSKALKTEFKRIKKFGTGFSSTVRGAKKWQKAVEDKAKETGRNVHGRGAITVGELWKILKEDYEDIIVMYSASEVNNAVIDAWLEDVMHPEEEIDPIDWVLKRLGGEEKAKQWKAERAARKTITLEEDE